MNQNSGQGIIISVRPHGEGGAVVHLLSEDMGKIGGYVNGAQSSARLRSMLQQGNIVNFDWQSKTDGQLGRFDLELEQDISATILDNSKALMVVKSLCDLLDMFLPEREAYSALFHGSVAFLNILKTDEWPAAYIMWEMAFLRELGYGIDMSKCAVSGVTDNLTHVSPKTGRAVCAAEAEPYKSKLLEIPEFLQGKGLSKDDVLKGLKLTGYFLTNRLLQQSSFYELPGCRQNLLSIL